MILFVDGNMFDTQYGAYVNPVNCMGVMGAGLALEFKNRFPSNFEAYKTVCDNGLLHPGDVYKYRVDLTSPNDRSIYIFNFATKDHWKDPSKLEWINIGCFKIRKYLDTNNNIKSIAFPMLGCGLGGLRWKNVRKIILRYFNDAIDKDIYIYGPENS